MPSRSWRPLDSNERSRPTESRIVRLDRPRDGLRRLRPGSSRAYGVVLLRRDELDGETVVEIRLVERPLHPRRPLLVLDAHRGRRAALPEGRRTSVDALVVEDDAARLKQHDLEGQPIARAVA